MKRKLKWLAVVLAVSLLGFGTALLLWPRDRITAESWQKIRIGMTEEEVAEILGGRGMSVEEFDARYDRAKKELGRPPFKVENSWLEEGEGKRDVGDMTRIWTGRRGGMRIEFDHDNCVRGKVFGGLRWSNEGFLDRLRDSLGW
jgi:hypothetical protein